MYTQNNLQMYAIRTTEEAAISCYQMMGRGDETLADSLAVEAMRKALNKINIQGTIVIGEGERDKAPMLYIGEQVGTGQGEEIDIALDPLEGTSILARGSSNALSAIAMSPKGGLLNAPDVYMDKIAVGALPAALENEKIVDLDYSVENNLDNVAKAKGRKIKDLVVVILDRQRNDHLITQVRKAGARIQLIRDGDLATVVALSLPNSGIDMYMGIGGAPEGVLSASAFATLGGQMCCRLIFNHQEEKDRAKRMGINDFQKKYYLNDLVKLDVTFAATGVTDGSILKGVRHVNNMVITNTICTCSRSKEVRILETEHRK